MKTSYYQFVDIPWIVNNYKMDSETGEISRPILDIDICSSTVITKYKSPIKSHIIYNFKIFKEYVSDNNVHIGFIQNNTHYAQYSSAISLYLLTRGIYIYKSQFDIDKRVHI